MGQSQPNKSPPICESLTNPGINGHPDDLLNSTLMKKLGNYKMFPSKDFRAFVQSTDDQSNRIDKSQVYNDSNCSIYERELPDELFIHILGYLTSTELMRTRRVSKNYKNYWIENIDLWRGRPFEGSADGFEPFMYFKPILETPVQTIVYYYNHFLSSIVNSFTEILKVENIFMVAKYVLLGAEKCGKSEFMKMILNSGRELDPNYTPTIGVEFGAISFKCNNNQIFKLQLWDCSGSPRFFTILRAYTRGARVIVFCFDLSNAESFIDMKDSVTNFVTQNFSQNISINENLKSEKQSMIIIGMKRDLERQVSVAQVGEYLSELFPESNNGMLMNELRVQYFELSSKTDRKQSLLFPLFYGLLLVEEEMIKEKRDENKLPPIQHMDAVK